MEELLCVQEAKAELFQRMESFSGFRFLKSMNCLRAKAGNFVFELQFYFDKYNLSYEYIGMECDFVIWYRKFGKSCDADTYVTGYTYRKDGSWFEITTREQLNTACRTLEELLSDTMLKIYAMFIEDEKGAVEYLLQNDASHPFALDAAADVLGLDAVKKIAQKIYLAIPEEEVEAYYDVSKPKEKAWMINRCDARFVLDHHLYQK